VYTPGDSLLSRNYVILVRAVPPRSEMQQDVEALKKIMKNKE
jgi:hypothetical protein